ncbi:isoprenylcysteine carboxyl methyltransferase family protein [Aneurinibacillus terranovensis]|uniref:isoprenylcysteine carboxyl methyltransferase family protein n=1 Tax=Aneurinibacillus terranovensis TaxID=278991 RepID=UPI0004055249|nr:isoprenylcysteine carboxylmethyltransferase family protein [Aneurinibacillus terranovensis]
MLIFYAVFVFLIVQRLVELKVAKRNRAWMMSRGGKEIGAGHYPLMVLMHAGFFISLWTESAWKGYPLSVFWKALLGVLLVVQLLRYWAIVSLGRCWNTRIIYVPGGEAVRKGPYRFLRHPNYVVVILEFAVIPLFFKAYVTFFTFSLLNAIMLRHRIRVEEQALLSHTSYSRVMGDRRRFMPGRPE